MYTRQEFKDIVTKITDHVAYGGITSFSLYPDNNWPVGKFKSSLIKNEVFSFGSRYSEKFPSTMREMVDHKFGFSVDFTNTFTRHKCQPFSDLFNYRMEIPLTMINFQHLQWQGERLWAAGTRNAYWWYKLAFMHKMLNLMTDSFGIVYTTKDQYVLVQNPNDIPIFMYALEHFGEEFFATPAEKS